MTSFSNIYRVLAALRPDVLLVPVAGLEPATS
jgi:hypothetical protein